MTEFVYAIRLAPSGRIKVGRTNQLGSRISRHTEAAAFGGAFLDQVFSAACENSTAAEREIITTLHALPGARLVHGKETFSGVAFPVVAAIVDDAARRAGEGSIPEVPDDTPLSIPVPDLLRAVFDHAVDLADSERVPTLEILKRFAPDLNITIIGRTFRSWGAPSGRDRNGPSGPKVGDIRAAVYRCLQGEELATTIRRRRKRPA